MPGTLKLNSGGAGNLILTPSGSVGSDVTVTVPAVTGTVAVSSNIPAFRAYQSSSQSISATTETKVNFQSESFDTNNNFDTSTSRFTPTVAGYYCVTLLVQVLAATNTQATIRKNGSTEIQGQYMVGTVSYGATVSGTIYMNGSTDYLEGVMYTSGASSVYAAATSTYFTGFLARAA